MQESPKFMSEPKFTPKAGQVDYTNIRYAPVVNTVVTKDGKVLLMQRSKELRLYPGYWNGVSGFLDDNRRIEDKVLEELSEELGLSKSDIVSLKRGTPILQEAEEYGKTWLVVPMLAVIKIEDFKLDWEASQAKWFEPRQIEKLKLLPGFKAVISQFFDI